MSTSQGGVSNMVYCFTFCIQNKAQQVLHVMPLIELKQLEGILRPWREGHNSSAACY